MSNLVTFNTKYGNITLYENDVFIGGSFKNDYYYDEENLIALKEFIDPNRNILEIGGHCGTSSIVYSTYLNDNNKIFVYEPQKKLFELLVENIKQNNRGNKIIPFNKGVFCYEGDARMNMVDIDGGGGIVNRRYNEENKLPCNFGGIGLGAGGELINTTTIDNMNLDNIGFIHCDAQGSENFIFSKGTETIKKYRPHIIYERESDQFYNNICTTYPQYKRESLFDLKHFCMEELKYSKCIERFKGTYDTLLIP